MEPVIAFYDQDCVVKISTNASKDGLGEVFLQEKRKVWQQVAYASRSMTKAEQRYVQIEKECLSLVLSCNRFHYYVGIVGIVGIMLC